MWRVEFICYYLFLLSNLVWLFGKRFWRYFLAFIKIVLKTCRIVYICVLQIFLFHLTVLSEGIFNACIIINIVFLMKKSLLSVIGLSNKSTFSFLIWVKALGSLIFCWRILWEGSKILFFQLLVYFWLGTFVLYFFLFLLSWWVIKIFLWLRGRAN